MDFCIALVQRVAGVLYHAEHLQLTECYAISGEKAVQGLPGLGYAGSEELEKQLQPQSIDLGPLGGRVGGGASADPLSAIADDSSPQESESTAGQAMDLLEEDDPSWGLPAEIREPPPGEPDPKVVVRSSYFNWNLKSELVRQLFVLFSQTSLQCLSLSLFGRFTTCSLPMVQAKVKQFLEIQRKGKLLTESLRQSRDYRNPDFLRQAVEYNGIDEFGTCFPPDRFDPTSVPPEDFAASLAKEFIK